jgi:hypothetical protein
MKNPENRERINLCTYTGKAKGPEACLDCLKTLLRSCSIQNPTWLELINFASFLDFQVFVS